VTIFTDSRRQRFRTSQIRHEGIVTKQRLLAAALVLALTFPAQEALGQTSPASIDAPSPQSLQVSSTSSVPRSQSPADTIPLLSTTAPQPLFDFKESDIKFNLQSLMDVLRDRRHEGWVLAAYPDPKTTRPLIGAGFSLDVATTDHPQTDPLNPHPFIEPSSAQLWQAAGFDADRLQRILDQYDRNLSAWGTKRYRRKIRAHTLTPELTEEEATRLLRISAIQAVVNARAYCRDFDKLTAPQQMALSQLVFQMGVNLEEFVQFLGVLNGNAIISEPPQPSVGAVTDADHWNAVQRTLIDSQWARRYSDRASTVIAMFDPIYVQDPGGAERRVAATLRPPPTKHHRKAPPAASLRASNESHCKAPGKKASSQHKRKLT
jgi:hypothetical protein